MPNDVDGELVIVEVHRGEGSERGTATIGEEELVAVPRRQLEGLTRPGNEQSHARRRFWQLESLEFDPSDDDPHHPDRSWLGVEHGATAERRGFTPEAGGGVAHGLILPRPIRRAGGTHPVASCRP